jgi:hypothetical protein
MSFDWRDYLPATATVLATSLIAATLVLGALKVSGQLDRSPANLQAAQVVVFDVVKYVNAQRAVASGLLGNDANVNLDTSTFLLALSKRAKGSILKIAGSETVVLVRQAVIQGDAPDITDAVLIDLGLPTDVPTQAPVDYVTGGKSPLAGPGRRPAARSRAQPDAPSTDSVLP